MDQYDPPFEITDSLVYVNGFLFEESRSESFKIVEADESHQTFLLQNKESLKYKEVSFEVLFKEYQKEPS